MDANNELLHAIGRMMEEKLAAERENTRQMLEPINNRLENLEQGQAEIKQDVRELNQRVAIVESKVLHELGIIKEGIAGWQERNRQIDRLEDTADSHDHRIWALEQKSKAM